MRLVDAREQEATVQTTIDEVATLHSLLNEICHGLQSQDLWKSVAEGHGVACALLSRLDREFRSRIEERTRVLQPFGISGGAPEPPVALLNLSREDLALLPAVIGNVIEALGPEEFSTRSGTDMDDAKRLATEIDLILARM